MQSRILIAKLVSKAAFLQGFGAFKRLVQQEYLSIKEILFVNLILIDNFISIKLKVYKKYAESLICRLSFNNCTDELYLAKVGGNNPKATILSIGTITELETESKRRYVSHFLPISVKPSFLKIPITCLGTIALNFSFCIAFIQEILFSLLKGFKSADLRIENTKETKIFKKCSWSFLFICPVESDLMLF